MSVIVSPYLFNDEGCIFRAVEMRIEEHEPSAGFHSMEGLVRLALNPCGLSGIGWV
jgi:hypothetical protein